MPGLGPRVGLLCTPQSSSMLRCGSPLPLYSVDICRSICYVLCSEQYSLFRDFICMPSTDPTFTVRWMGWEFEGRAATCPQTPTPQNEQLPRTLSSKLVAQSAKSVGIYLQIRTSYGIIIPYNVLS